MSLPFVNLLIELLNSSEPKAENVSPFGVQSQMIVIFGSRETWYLRELLFFWQHFSISRMVHFSEVQDPGSWDQPPSGLEKNVLAIGFLD